MKTRLLMLAVTPPIMVAGWLVGLAVEISREMRERREVRS